MRERETKETGNRAAPIGDLSASGAQVEFQRAGATWPRLLTQALHGWVPGAQPRVFTQAQEWPASPASDLGREARAGRWRAGGAGPRCGPGPWPPLMLR